MSVLLEAIWPGILAAALIGCVVGGLAGRPGRWSAAAHVGLLAALAGAAALVPGRAGLWLEGAAWMLAAYLVAVVLAGLLRPAATGSYSSDPPAPPASPS
jgi:fluoride ion exporter CrcB/FEX